ncbi:hypothetical protein [Pontibacter korlensis]|uniref:hypothetical protein n=1 Tax=Pontibacter korlensis TaxID=400092 RepID=UPI0039EFCA4C
MNLLISCDDDDDETAEPSKREKLTAEPWEGDKVLLNNTDVATIPLIGSNASTFQTLRITFMDDNTYSATFTAQGQEQTQTGNWSMNNDETTITTDMFGEMQIRTLTDSNLDVTTTISPDNINFIGQVLGIDPRLIQAFTGGNPVNAELRFVR